MVMPFALLPGSATWNKELKNNIQIYFAQQLPTILELLSQNNILTILIHNLKTVWPTKIPMPFLSSLDKLLKVAYTIFQKKFW